MQNTLKIQKMRHYVSMAQTKPKTKNGKYGNVQNVMTMANNKDEAYKKIKAAGYHLNKSWVQPIAEYYFETYKAKNKIIK